MGTAGEEPFIEPWIDLTGWGSIDFSQVKTPCYIVSENHLLKNLRILEDVQKSTGCKILAALKSFSMYREFPLMKPFLAGAEASSVNEARLGFEEFGKEVHVFSPSYSEDNIEEYLEYAGHLVFNSFSQWKRFRSSVRDSGRKISCGIRVNPEHSEAEVPMYDPSAPNSHFGVTLKNFEPDELQEIEGLHFHNLCELDADALARTLAVFEEKFGPWLGNMKWVNFGGGHHITRPGYHIQLLKDIILGFRERYPHLEIYLEPGEAIALNAGVLVGQVLDVFNNGTDIAILNVSATTHMPDVLEMPYKPTILSAVNGNTSGSFRYKLAGPTCLTGDIIGTYDFPERLSVGDRLVFMNMAIYTMVKNNTFNGVDLPDIAVLDTSGHIEILHKFGYSDFKSRLS